MAGEIMAGEIRAGEIIAPGSEAELVDALAAACADKRALAIEGAGTKRGLGRPMSADAVLSTGGLSGITYYEPGELVMEAESGTPLAEIEAALAENHQQLAFEPPDLGPLYGGNPAKGTIGGVFACNLSGPRRPFAGAARDHLLGVRAVSGRGEAFTAGGRVVKNVTGYDMGKLLAGSFGTLAVLSRVTFKVLPRAEQQRTLLLTGTSADAALDALAMAAGESWEISAAAYVPARAAARSSVSYVSGAAEGIAAVRLEGRRDAVAARAAMVRGKLAELGETEELHTHNSLGFWKEVRDGALLPSAASDTTLWRLSVPPAAAATVQDAFADRAGAELLCDWSGGLVWLALPGDGAARITAERVRDAAAVAGGHATLWRADAALRAAVPVFTPQSAALAGVERRIKVNFDPHGILNPGRMYEGL